MGWKNKVEENKEALLRDLEGLIKIRSVKGSPQKNMPFGEGPAQALEYMLDLGEKLGMKTKNLDNYAGHIEIGEGDEILGVLAHLDVVPEGEGWDFDPFSGKVQDGKILGRGAIDDKGPAMAALYAMKMVAENNPDMQKRVRLILGTDEENGWGGIKYYLKHEEKPKMGFTPDANFPVIHGEMGIMVVELVKKIEKNAKKGCLVKKLKGGNAPNMVPDRCRIVIETEKTKEVLEKLDEFVLRTQYKLVGRAKNNKVTIDSEGLSAHGAWPEKGINAISQLMLFISELEFTQKEMNDIARFYAEKIGMNTDGEAINCGFKDNISGKLILNVGQIDFNAEVLKLTINIRYPITVTSEMIYEALRKETDLLKFGIVKGADMKPIYLEKDHALVKTLMSIYREFTQNKEIEPLVIPGGTYARAIDNAVAFGALFPDDLELEHQKNEYIKVESLMKATEIFSEAIDRLSK